MKRASLVAALAAVAMLVVGVGAPANAQGTLVDTRVLPSNGNIVDVALPPGAYELVVKGTFDYDVSRPGDQFADAECSTNQEGWDDPIDFVENNLPVPPLSPWHRYNYFVLTPESSFSPGIYERFGLPSRTHNIDALDVAIGARTVLGRLAPVAAVEWIPTPPTLTNSGGEIDLGCNETDHTYVFPIVIVPGVNALLFKIWDPTVVDNSGSLTLEVYRLPA